MDARGTEILSLERYIDCKALCTVLAAERIDLFINNAGFGTCGCFLDTDPEKELSMLRVNVLAMHRLFKFMLKKMDRQGSQSSYGTRFRPETIA